MNPNFQSLRRAFRVSSLIAAFIVSCALIGPHAQAQNVAASWVKVAGSGSGEPNSCALTSTGAVKCWGANPVIGSTTKLGTVNTASSVTTPSDVVGAGTGIAQASFFGRNLCTVDRSGGVKCRGVNSSGQAGIATTTDMEGFNTIASLANAKSLSVGYQHVCALTAGNGVQCWGFNFFGQVGDGTNVNIRTTPTNVSGLSSGVSVVSSGGNHSCAITSAGGVKCWGINDTGQLGDGSTANRSIPVDVSGLASGVTAISSGYAHTCAVSTGGALRCWGSNGLNQLGDGTNITRSVPVVVSGLSTGVASVASGSSHSCAVTTGGGVKCWGLNQHGQLGDGSTTSRSTPVDVVGLSSGVAAVSADDRHSCALLTNGGIKCWGDNRVGQLGDGTLTQRASPVDVTGFTVGQTLADAGSIHTGAQHNTCYRSPSGGVKCWGRNDTPSVLGTALTSTNVTLPTDVTGLATDVTKLGFAGMHQCVILSDGLVRCRGRNTNGQIGVGTTSTTENLSVIAAAGSASAVVAGRTHTCSLGTNGGVKCWGSNAQGQLGDGTTTQRTSPVDVNGLTSGVRAIAIGNTYSCAITTAGALKCWGAIAGSALVPTDIVGYSGDTLSVSVSTGDNSYACAVKASSAGGTSGGIKCWGTSNFFGPLGNPGDASMTPTDVTGLQTGWVSVSAGNNHTCAVNTAGAAKCWGFNAYGALGDGSTTNSKTPVDVVGLASGVVAISAGGDNGTVRNHTCASLSTGGVKCWGDNSFGQLGDNTTAQRNSPADVQGLSRPAQTITFPTVSATAAVYAPLGTFALAATASSGLAVTYVSTTTSVCTVSGSTVTKLTAGTCTIVASQAGNSNFAPAPDVALNITITPAPQSITFNFLSDRDLRSGPVSLTASSLASASSGLPLVFTSLTPTVCTVVNNASITLSTLGTCTIRASQSGNNNYQTAASADRSFFITSSLISQALSRASQNVGDTYTFVPGRTLSLLGAVTASSGLTVEYLVNTPNVCTLNGLIITMVTAGRCGLFASQAGDATYAPASTTSFDLFFVSAIAVPGQQISVGGGHTCALTSSGGVRCWGRNDFGQLGDGTTTNRASAVDVLGLYRGYVSVWTGAYHSCALSDAGAVRCWGLNDVGQLGDGTTTNRYLPTDVFGLLSGIAGIAAGERSSCAITTAGGLRCWGFNGFGQLGDGTLINRLFPADVVGLTSGVARIAMGQSHACVLTSGGGLKCWGDNSSGQLGDGSTIARLTAVDVFGMTSGLSTLALGALHSCAITNTGGLRCWGSNLDGRLGDGTVTNRLTAVNVSGLLAGITNLSLGAAHSCALTTAGALRCWGLNSDGRLGDGTTLSRLVPTDVSGLPSGIVALAAGLGNSCGVTSGGVVQCWGSNAYGQLGDGTFINRLIATAVQFAVAASSAPQAISFPIISGQAFSVGGTIDLSAFSSSGLALAYASLTQSICTVGSRNGSSGVVSFITMLTAGTCSVRATQLGDSVFGAAVPVVRSFSISAVNGAPSVTTVTLTSSRSNPVLGQLITLNATVTGSNGPTGTITFYDTSSGSNVLMCNAVPLAGNFATCAVPSANRLSGTRTYGVRYSGDARNAASTSALSQQITASRAALTLSLLPVRPSAGQTVTLTVQANLAAGLASSGTVSVTRNGSAVSGCNAVALSALAGASSAAVASCAIANLTAGDSTLSVSYSGDNANGTAQASVPLTVAATGARDYSDLWWSGPSEDGWGMTIMQKGNTQFNAFYVYGPDGRPLWYVMPGGTWNADFTSITGALYAPKSSQLGAYDTTQFTAGNSVGSATLTFSSNSAGRFDYTINGITASKQIIRQQFGVTDAQPRLSTMDLWWGGTFENGWGFALAQQQRTIFGVWFTYDTNGDGTWLVMPGGAWSGMTYTGDLYTTTGSPWLGTTYDPTKIKATKVGNVSLAFSDADNAVMTYTINGATQVKVISRQPF